MKINYDILMKPLIRHRCLLQIVNESKLTMFLHESYDSVGVTHEMTSKSAFCDIMIALQVDHANMRNKVIVKKPNCLFC